MWNREAKDDHLLSPGCSHVTRYPKKNILVELNNLQMLFYSTIFSCIVLCGIVLFEKKSKVLTTYSMKDYTKIGMLGFLGTYLYYVLLYAALAVRYFIHLLV
jgi:prolipoprotein diacylglyceryltransferase